jgi:hypothetical protein
MPIEVAAGLLLIGGVALGPTLRGNKGRTRPASVGIHAARII